MLVTHSLLFYVHIVFGSAALLLFWVPLLSRKGGLDHRRFGRYYSYAMYTVSLTGFFMAIIVLIDPLAIHGHGYADQDPVKVATALRRFWLFLLFLSVLTFASVRHGNLVLAAKRGLANLRHPSHILLLVLLLATAFVTLIAGVSGSRTHTLHIIFGCLGLLIGTQMLRFSLGAAAQPQAFIVEHLSSLVGSGIGAYTAFLTFGARHLLSDLGQWQLLFWLLPGVIGSIFISFQSRKIRKVSTTAVVQPNMD